MTPTKKLRGQDLFDSRVFQDAASTSTFYRFIASLREKIRDEVKDTSGTHKFIKTLRDGGRLMRCYTQNIDCLEAREGLVTDLKRGKGNKRRFMKKHYEEHRPVNTIGTDHDGGCEVVQLHGELNTLRCTVCSTQWTWTENETDVFMEGFAPRCKKCARKSQERQETGKRGLAVGSLRPNIVLYGEDHPQNSLLSPFVPYDTACQPDVLIIMGTSLKVFGLQKIIREFAKAVHAQKKGRVIFVNRTRPAESVWDSFIDYFVPMDCDDWVNNLKQRRADIWLHQGNIDETMKPKKKRKSTATKQKNIEVVIPSAPRINTPSKVVKSPSKSKSPLSSRSKTMNLASILNSPSKLRSPSTPRRPQEKENFRQKLLSPLRRATKPETATLSDSSKPRAPSKFGRSVPDTPKTPAYSPITPAVFSPITPAPFSPIAARVYKSSALRKTFTIATDPDVEPPEDIIELEIQESDHEKENVPDLESDSAESPVQDLIPNTPTKPRFENRIYQLINISPEGKARFGGASKGLVHGHPEPAIKRRSSGRRSGLVMKSPR